MGTVYRGIDEQFSKVVAVKHLRAEVTDSEKVQRFKREGEILRKLNHPNIVQLLDAVELNGEHYLIMELIAGGLLREKLGRSSQIAELKELLQDSQTRLITILAQGGMGKTRLSIEVARQLTNYFSQGVTFVPLARIPSTEYVAQTIAEELGLALSSQDDPKIQLLNYLKNSEMLLTLDNFEHVLEGAGLVTEMLESSPQIKILVTSRERLNLQSEVPYNLPSMNIADWQTVDEAMTYSAAQLFVQGARRSRSDFTLQQADINGLTRICKFVDGMPLRSRLP